MLAEVNRDNGQLRQATSDVFGVFQGVHVRSELS